MYYLQSRYYNPTWGRFINADALVSTGQGILGNNMFAYCNNNPVMYLDCNGMQPTDLYYTSAGEGDAIAKQGTKKKWIPRKDKRHGSDGRQKTGGRERNIGHKNGEEHSRKPKGNGMPIRKMEGSVLNDNVSQQATLLIPVFGGLAMGLVYTYLDYVLLHYSIQH